MTDRSFYHEGNRELQEMFETRPLADRMVQTILHSTFTDSDREFIENCSMFFLATADGEGRPDCSYKGGMPGFVRVVDEQTIAFPNYDGNGMYRSLGNMRVNPHVGIVLVDFEASRRMRINGVATLHPDDELISESPGAQLIVRVRAQEVFPNCPRYLHKMELIEHSKHVPRPDHSPPRPEWKDSPKFRDALPPRDRLDTPA